jgi:hypothetical protein
MDAENAEWNPGRFQTLECSERERSAITPAIASRKMRVTVPVWPTAGIGSAAIGVAVGVEVGGAGVIVGVGVVGVSVGVGAVGVLVGGIGVFVGVGGTGVFVGVT